MCCVIAMIYFSRIYCHCEDFCDHRNKINFVHRFISLPQNSDPGECIAVYYIHCALSQSNYIAPAAARELVDALLNYGICMHTAADLLCKLFSVQTFRCN